ncbi:MAG: NosD domain-containing protein [Candidatus Aenigmatarchaeota archaeon]
MLDKKGIKAVTMFVTVLLILSIYIGGIGFSSPGEESTSGEEKIVLARLSGGDVKNVLSDVDAEVIERYGDLALLKADQSTIASLEDDIQINTLPSRTELSVKDHTFDIEDDEPGLTHDHLTIEGYESGEEGLYIVHTLGPVDPEWRGELEKLDLQILNYVPNYAYEVRMTPETAEKVEDFFFVDWVGIYQPEYKISSSLPEVVEDKLTLNVKLVPGSDPAVVDTIRSEFLLNRSMGLEDRLTVDVTSREEVEKLAMMNEVYYISRYIEPELHSEVESQIIGGGAWIMDDEHQDPSQPYRKHGDHGAYINQLGYSGEGVVIAMADTGIGNGTPGSAGHPDLTGRVVGGHGFEDLDDDEWYDGHGHGTHVTGSAAGDTFHGAGEKGEYPGSAPYYMAQGLAYRSELYAAKIFDPGWVEAEYYDIVEVPKQEAEAYVHSNSWGARSSGEYTESDEIFDQAVRDADRNTTGNQPMVITVSAGNAGPSEQTTGSPGNAKNVITVGATKTFMPDGSYFGGSDTEDPGNIARFSSRGWTEDNRIKPDIVAPGENVLSLGNPNFRVGGTYDWKSGTSMSNPAVAGAAAVVVEWYEENFGEKPSPAMVKSLLINTAEDPAKDCRTESVPNKDVGWGMADLSKLEYPKEDPVPFLLEDQTNSLQTGERDIYEVKPDRSDEPFKISLVWTDENATAGDNTTLKNDLNLEVESPSGEIYRGNSFENGWTLPGRDAVEDFDSTGNGLDDVNNVENVYIHPDDIEDGTYQVRVVGFNVPADATNDGEPNQDYALAVHNAESPSVEITGPSEEDTVRESTVTVEWNADTSASTQLRLDGESWKDVGSDTAYTFNGLDDGYHEVEVRTTDENGNGGKDKVEFFVDTEPYLQIIHPFEEETIRKDELAVEWTSCNIGSCEVRLDGGEWVPAEDPTYHTFEGLEDGEYLLEVRGSEEEITERVNFSVDTSPYIEIASPREGEEFTDEVKVDWTSAQVERHEIRLDGGNWMDVSTNTTYKFEDLSRGRHTITVRAFDEPGTEQSVDVIYYEERDPIEIEGDDDLEEKAEENDWEGDGTEDDPYLIEWYNIDGGGKRSAIHIEDVQDHFVVRNNQLYNANRTTDEDIGNSGVYLQETENGRIEGNELRRNSYGIRLDSSDENIVVDNTAINNHAGIYVTDSEGNEIDQNNVSKYHYPVYGQGISIEDSPAQKISNNHGVNNEEGLFQTSSDESLLQDNNFSYSDVGIQIEDSSGNELRKNHLFMDYRGLYLRSSTDSEMIENDIRKNTYGIYMTSSDKNNVTENLLKGNYYGLRVSHSKENEVEDNRVVKSMSFGIYLFSSEAQQLSGNELVDNSLYIWGRAVESWNTHTIDESNSINGRPIVYLKNEEGTTISGEKEAGEIILANSTGITVEEQEIEDGDVGILLGFSDENEIKDNVINDQVYGVALRYSNRNKVKGNTIYNGTAAVYVADSHANTIAENNLTKNSWPGVYLTSSNKNLIFGNTFTDNYPYTIYLTRSENNTVYHNEVRNEELPEESEGQAFDNSNNRWDDGSEGNFWSDYLDRYPEASEENDRGIWNKSYDIAGDGNKDEHPLSSTDPMGDLRVQIYHPIDDGTVFSSEVTVLWASKGGQGEVDYKVRLDDQDWESTEETSYTFEGLEDGEHELKVEAEDDEGTVSSHHVTFTVYTGLHVQITSPDEAETFRRTRVSIEWTAENAEHIEVKLDGPGDQEGDWEDVEDEREHTYEGLEDGDYTVTVRLEDERGNTASDSVNFAVRTVHLEITSPENGDEITGDTVTVEWSSENAEYHEIQICGDRWDNVGDVTEYEIKGLIQGEYKISVRARDETGRRSTDSVTITVDYPLITSPNDGTIFAEEEVTLRWRSPSVADGRGRYFEIRLNEDEWKDLGYSTEYTFESLEDGEYTAEIRIMDECGNIAHDSVTFLVDTTSPDLSIEVPDKSSTVGASRVTITWEGEDRTSGIKRYEIRINGGEWKEPDSGSKHTFIGLSEGEHTVEIRAHDRAGNNVTDSVTFEVEEEEGLPNYLWTMIAIVITVAVLFLVRIGLFMIKEEEPTPRKSLPELEREHGSVSYRENEDEYKL